MSGALVAAGSPTAAGYTFTGLSFSLDVWAVKAPMPTARYGLAAAEVGGKIYAIGGEGSRGRLQVVEEYDPVSNTWTTKAPMPTTRAYLAAGAVGGKIYAIGGFGNNTTLNVDTSLKVVEEYNPASNTWTTKAPMPTTRSDLAAAEVGGKIYAIGGYPNRTVVEEYDPASDTWTTKAPMPTGRHELAAAAVGGKIYAMGGASSGAFLNVVEEYTPGPRVTGYILYKN